MRKICIFILLFLPLFVRAEVVKIRLKTGEVYRGEVMHKTDDVVIFRTADGRFQYPMEQVESIEAVEEQVAAGEVKKVAVKEKKVGIDIELMGGVGSISRDDAEKGKAGGLVGGMIGVGACRLAGRDLFLGGVVGWDSYIVGGKTHSFIPLAVRFMIPLTTNKLAPMVGGSVGYGFRASKSMRGGLYANLDVGIYYKINEKNSLAVSLSAKLQQGGIEVIENIGENSYTGQYTRLFWAIGPKVTVVL